MIPISTRGPSAPFAGIADRAIVQHTQAGELVTAERGFFGRIVQFFRGESPSAIEATRQAVVEEMHNRFQKELQVDVDPKVLHQALRAARGEVLGAGQSASRPITVRQVRDAYQHVMNFAPALTLRAARQKAIEAGANMAPAPAEHPPAPRLPASFPGSPEVTRGRGTFRCKDPGLFESTLGPDEQEAKEGGTPVRTVKPSADGAQEFFGSGFYVDLDRMQVLLEDRIGNTRQIGRGDSSEMKSRAIDQLVEFVGDETFAARVSRFIHQAAAVPFSAALEHPDCPIKLPDGAHGQLQTPKGSTSSPLSFTLSKSDDGAVRVRVQKEYRQISMVNLENGPRSVDPAHSYATMAYEFRLTPDEAKVTSPMTYDFLLAELPEAPA